MSHWLVLADFMYFPKDKHDYIPGVISLTIFMIGAIFTMRFFVVHSRKEAQKAKELEDKIMNQPPSQEQ